MKSKPRDIPYCGVRKAKIDDFSVEHINVEHLNTFLYFIKERYKIHLLKDIQQKPAPWTEDPVLQTYRFCNVRRELDKNSRWLIEHISVNGNLSYSEKIVNSLLFRLFNKIESAQTLQLPVKRNEYSSLVKRSQLLPEEHFVTGAYMSSGMLREFHQITKTMDSRAAIPRMVQYMYKTGILNALSRAKTPKQVVSAFRAYNGFSSFMAYQLFVDLTYIYDFPFSENEFTVAGPGAEQGLKYLFNSTAGLTPEELIFWLRDNFKLLNQYNRQCGNKHQFNPQKRMSDLPTHDRVMNVMSLENCLCEFSKYCKTITNTGRPRQKYIRRTT